MMTNQTAATARKAAVKAAMQRASLALIPQHAPGIVALEAQRDADHLIQAAIVLCSRGGRVDLAKRLLAVSAELRTPGSDLAKALETLAADTAEPRKAPVPAKAPRRKLITKGSPGRRARALMAKRGAVTA